MTHDYQEEPEADIIFFCKTWSVMSKYVQTKDVSQNNDNVQPTLVLSILLISIDENSALIMVQ